MKYPLKTFEENHPASLISCSKVVSRMIEFDCWYDIGYSGSRLACERNRDGRKVYLLWYPQHRLYHQNIYKCISKCITREYMRRYCAKCQLGVVCSSLTMMRLVALQPVDDNQPNEVECKLEQECSARYARIRVNRWAVYSVADRLSGHLMTLACCWRTRCWRRQVAVVRYGRLEFEVADHTMLTAPVPIEITRTSISGSGRDYPVIHWPRISFHASIAWTCLWECD